jgi:carboxymethylenebutenolidase
MPGSIVELTVDDSQMPTYVAVPEGDGPFPAVTVAQHRLGIDGFMRDICDRLAVAGFVAAAPDIYHRGWSREQFDEITAMPRGDERAEAILPSLSAALTEPEVVRDMTATFKHLKDHPAVDRSRLGMLGFCMGGRISYLMATRNASLKATACFYPGGIFSSRGGGPSAFAASDRIESPIIGFSGANDENPSPADMERVDKELTRLKVEHEFHLYDGMSHAFMDPTNPRAYSDEVVNDAWSKLIAFYDTKLKGN